MMQTPYIFSSSREFVREAVDFDNQRGVTYQEVGGEHSIWAARVPFLPAMVSEDFTRFGRDRVQYVMERQFRFITDLARARDHRATFELRFISTPNPTPGQPNLIDMVFLGKVFSTRQRAGHALAERLWEKFISNFPLEEPFNYPIEPVVDPADFHRYYEPIPHAELRPAAVLEIRKYEDMPIRGTASLGRVERKGDYVAHPFVPSGESNPMARFFAALAAQVQRCYVGISLRPTRMFDQEVFNVSFAIGQFKKIISQDDDVTEEYIRSRSGIGTYVYEQLMEEREQLVMVRVHVVGEHEAPFGLAEALGSEIVGNAKNVYPTQWSAAQPADDAEMALALNNLRFLEHDFWGHTIAPPPLARLRYLATSHEAYGAFRLPVPPEAGHMPGVLVKDEPFVAPADELELRRLARANLDDAQQASHEAASEKKVGLGVVYHRGSPTAQTFYVNVRDLTRHTLIGGSTGRGKSTTIKWLLSQLWSQYQIPFLVLYPLDKPDYRELRLVPGLANDLLVFTLGDESTAPFRFNPFEVPDGLLLKTHLSRLMRVFTSAFTLQDPLPMIYREALRRVYRDKGWGTVLERGAPDREYPTMSEFYASIKRITDGLDYGREVKDNVRQASVIRIADLLENAGHVVNVRRSMSFQAILNRLVVMEIGRVGSVQDTSLLMGFLLMRFAEEVERNPRPADHPHITVVEEAHRLMAETAPVAQGADSRGAAGEDFSNILAEVRGYGEAIVIAEQIPTLLVKGAIGNTYLKVMHWLEDAPSFELFANIMNLDRQQRAQARTLGAGFAVVRSPYGRPVHLKVPEAEDQASLLSLPFASKGGPIALPLPSQQGRAKSGLSTKAGGETRPHSPADNSDAGIRQFMAAQRERLGLDDVPVVPWDSSLSVGASAPPSKAAAAAPANAAVGPWRASPDALRLLLTAPMQTCTFCQALHRTGKCQYGATVQRRLVGDRAFHAARSADFDAALAEADESRRWAAIQDVAAHVEASVHSLDPADRRGIVYCYLAHAADTLVRDAAHQLPPHDQVVQRARGLLQQFEARYPTASVAPGE